MKNLQQLTSKTASEDQNGSIKFTHNNINPKCKWTKYTNQKTQTGKLDKNPKPISVLYPENPCKDTQRLKIKGWRKIYQANGEQKKKKAGVAILISDKIDFKAQRSKETKKAIT